MVKVLLLADFKREALRKVVCETGLLLAVILCFSAGAVGQRTISTTEFFNLGTQEVGVSNNSSQSKSPKMPWVEEYEFRTETRDFDFEQQEYTFRMSPSTGRIRRALTALYDHQEVVPDFDALESQCDDLAERYATWLELYLIDREKSILAQLKTILNDRQLVLNRQAGSLDFDWSKLISLRQDITDLDLRFSRLNTEVTRINSQLGLVMPSFSFAGFISLAKIGERFPGPFNLASDPKLDYELETIARELELEKAERKQYFNFAQLRYQGPHTDPFQERFSVGLAFQLPNSGQKLVKMRELELEERALRTEQSVALASDRAEYEEDVAAWRIEFGHFDFMTEAHREEKEELIRIANQLKRKEGFNPLPLLEIEERSLRNELRLLGLSANLYQSYLKIRERAGELCEAVNGELLLQ